jgi:glycerophosphoryl diester phosphodiesterase/HEAT repeat protein
MHLCFLGLAATPISNINSERLPSMKMSPLLFVFLALAVPSSHAGILHRGKVQMFCHRTANTDAPENTLESLALAARMGCDLVELDIRRTLDGQLVLNHDGVLDRLTTSTGTVEQSSSDELSLLDSGVWMGQRFKDMHIPSFDDALDVAREQGIELYLDMKTKGEGALILEALQRHGMLERVVFGGEWGDIRPLYPAANSDPVKYLPPGSTVEQISNLQHDGYFVVVNFSANSHDMDLPSMRAAVAAGADAINVDYPRLGADAIGRPVEEKIATLARTAATGSIPTRVAAIRELSRYEGFPTQQLFARWLRDPDAQISRAAAVALVIARPQTPLPVLMDALGAPEETARRNAAWALGMLGAPVASSLAQLLNSNDPKILEEALFALSRCPGDVPANRLLPFLNNETLTVRGAAALALARHQPQAAAHELPILLAQAEQHAAQIQAQHARGNGNYTQQEIDSISANFAEQMKLVQALELLPPTDAQKLLETQAFHTLDEHSSMNALVAGYQLWDRIDGDPAGAVQALSSTDEQVANRAEWVLVKASPAVLPIMRDDLRSATPPARERLIRILAWQGDRESLPLLRELQQSSSESRALIDWAIQKIQTLSFTP